MKDYDETMAMVDEFEPYVGRVTTPVLNVRAKADKNGKVVTTITPGNYTIVEEENGFGLLKSYASGRNGWVSLDFINRI